MPIDVRFDEDRELLRITLSDSWPTLPEIVAERSRLILEGYVRPGIVELVDARRVTRGIPNLPQLRTILQAIGSLPSKRAVLVSPTIQQAARNVAQTLDPHGVRLFRDESLAMDWLFGHHPTGTSEQTTPAKLLG